MNPADIMTRWRAGVAHKASPVRPPVAHADQDHGQGQQLPDFHADVEGQQVRTRPSGEISYSWILVAGPKPWIRPKISVAALVG